MARWFAAALVAGCALPGAGYGESRVPMVAMLARLICVELLPHQHLQLPCCQ